MPTIELNSSFAITDAAGVGTASPASVFTAQYDVDEVDHRTLTLGEGATQTIPLGLLEYVRFLAIQSDVLLGVALNGDDPFLGQNWVGTDLEARSLSLTNHGIVFDTGVATGGSATHLADTEKSWVFTTAEGRVRSEGSITHPGKLAFVLEVDACVGYIEIEIDPGDTITEVVSAIQTAINNAEGIGTGYVTVSWVDKGSSTGHFRLVSVQPGRLDILVRAHQADQRSLAVLGLDTMTTTLGSETLVGMDVRIVAGDNADDSQEITTVQRQRIDVGAFTAAVAAGSEYRIMKPSDGTITLLMAR